MDTQIKLTASSQTTPKEIETIFQQNEIEWIYDYDSKKLSIIKLDESIFSDCNNKEFSLGIYGWDKQREIVKTIILGSDLNYPIDLNLKKDFDDFLGIPRFKIIIFENKTKRIMKSSKDFIMTDKDQKDSLIKMIPQRIGNKIAELDLQDLDEGPIIYISTNFKNDNGIMPFNTLKKITKENPFFCMGFWPTILKEIFEAAADNPKKDWSQKWFSYISTLSEGYIQNGSDGKLEPAGNDTNAFKKSISSIVNLFINERNFDQAIFDEFNKEVEE